jgi:hypothetical protein
MGNADRYLYDFQIPVTSGGANANTSMAPNGVQIVPPLKQNALELLGF